MRLLSKNKPLTTDLKKELKNRKWPEKVPMPITDYSPFVKEGHLINRALRLHNRISKPICPGESAITSLCCGNNGKIYGATSGTKRHLFFYDPAPYADGVCDIGVIEGACGINKTLVAAPDDNLIFGGVSEGVIGKSEGYLFCYNPKNDIMTEFNNMCGVIEKLLVPVPGEYIAGLAIDNKQKVIYGLSRPGGHLFAYDIRRQKVIIKGQIDKDGRFSSMLVTDGSGNVYAAGGFGALFKYNPVSDSLTKLPVTVPVLAGRSLYNGLDAAVFNKFDGNIYGGSSADGLLFAFNPQINTIQTIGKPAAENGCPALAVGHNGCIYGICGEKNGMARLFKYNPVNHSLNDLGMPLASSEEFWHGYEFGSACTGPFGELYLGESDRISHLFIYFPPM